MTRKTQCTEFFFPVQGMADLTHFLQEFKVTLNTLEQCVDFKDYEELEYWRNRAEVGYRNDLKYFYFDRNIVIND